MYTISKIKARSLGKTLGLFLALLGAINALIYTIIFLIGLVSGTIGNLSVPVVIISLFIILPLFYGLFGVFLGLITALLYNLVALITGGIKIELSETTEKPKSRSRKSSGPPTIINAL